jgi:dTDP-4-amino-4,6-dideoxygalactose transaminase
MESLITDKTKAIMPVHLYGNAVDMPRLMEIALRHNLKVIEDCAQSFGASWQGKMTGTFGDVGSFSFYPSKNLSCFGDGGLIATNSETAYKEIMALRNHGSYVRYHHEKLGYNCRLDEIQAAILRVKLKHIDDFNEARIKVAKLYTQALQGVVVTPHFSTLGTHIFHQYTILHPNRDAIMAALKQANISSMIYYPIPIHRQGLFHGQYDHLQLPVSDDYTAQCLSLPIYPEMTIEQIHQVTDTICRAVA